METNKENLGHVLIVARTKTHLIALREYGRPNPEWKLPGGKLELNETPPEGARRELEEETGIRIEDPSSFTLKLTRTLPGNPLRFPQYLYEVVVDTSVMNKFVDAIHLQSFADEHFEVTAKRMFEVARPTDFLKAHHEALQEAGIIRPLAHNHT